ncbi:hypothetical protein ACLOJK_040405 [Asimina triloba]
MEAAPGRWTLVDDTRRRRHIGHGINREAGPVGPPCYRTAAAPLAPDLLRAFEEKFPGLQVPVVYGLTEHSSCITLTHGDPNKGQRSAKKNSVGFILPNLEVKFIDPDTGRSLPRNTPGELCVRSQCAMHGYYRNKEETRRTIDSKAWLRTGDVGYIDDDGDFFIIDRIKELINYKGFQASFLSMKVKRQKFNVVRQDAYVHGGRQNFTKKLRKKYNTPSQISLPTEVTPYCNSRAPLEYPKNCLMVHQISCTAGAPHLVLHLLPQRKNPPVGDLRRRRLVAGGGQASTGNGRRATGGRLSVVGRLWRGRSGRGRDGFRDAGGVPVGFPDDERRTAGCRSELDPVGAGRTNRRQAAGRSTTDAVPDGRSETAVGRANLGATPTIGAPMGACRRTTLRGIFSFDAVADGVPTLAEMALAGRRRGFDPVDDEGNRRKQRTGGGQTGRALDAADDDFPSTDDGLTDDRHGLATVESSAFPDEEAGEIPAACVVISPNAKESEEDMKKYVSSNVATYKRVRVVQFVQNIPKSAAGKILRRTVRDDMLRRMQATKNAFDQGA